MGVVLGMHARSSPLIRRMDWTFDAAWRAAYLSRLRTLLPGCDAAELELLGLEDTLAALGRAGEEHLGIREVPVTDIVGSVSRMRDFDRRMRPRSRHLRHRWEVIADTRRELPPVALVQVGELFFVEDGHHRVSIARARGAATLAARVHRIRTEVCANRQLTVADLPERAAQRLLLERLPLPDDVRVGLRLDRPSDWRDAVEAAEAWGFRRNLEGPPLRDRCELATAWWSTEVAPILEGLRCRGLCIADGDVSAYLRHRLDAELTGGA